MITFYDTCSLLLLQQKAFESKFYISSITLTELENIKTSSTKDEETKWAARQLLHLLEQNEGKYEVVVYKDFMDTIIEEFTLPKNNDSRIIASAIHLIETENDDLVFITDDLACKMIASSIGMNAIFASTEDKDEYTGYTQIKMNDEELADFYSNILISNDNPYQLKDNEYLLVVDKENKIIDKYKWLIDKYIKIPFIKAESKMFGKITPKDAYQQIALDSLNSNQFTMIKGPAGSGKDHLGLGYLFSLLEQGKIDKIFIFVNPVATKGAAKLGYLPGDKNSKILDSQIGNFLIGKLGGLEIVYQMIEKDQLVLMPLSDIRGVDLAGTHAALYITEAQNMSISMMKLALQRVGEDTLVIINGDTECQVDLREYAGKNNGMRRASEIFRGQEYYGEVTLQEIYRSRITKQADKM